MSSNPIIYSDFPNLFQASDAASRKAQLYYLIIVASDLAFMIMGAAIAIYDYKFIATKVHLYEVSAFSLLLSLILTILLKTKKFEDTWYQGRALAESCKTISWRFMMGSKDFERSLNSDEAEERFVEKLRELSDEFVDLNSHLDATIIGYQVITETMISIRSLSPIDRKEYYLKYRIIDQKTWYSSKADFNEFRYNLWFGVIIFSQACSLISVIYLVANPTSHWNLVSFFTTLSSCAISWLQLKQHQELKQAYTTAAQELNFILALSNKIHTEEELSDFVLDSENAISREHTLWLAQRRKKY